MARDTLPDVDSALIDVQEHGAPRDGEPQTMDRRLFMKLSVFDCPGDVQLESVISEWGRVITAERRQAVIYHDVHDSRALAVLLWSQQPAELVHMQQSLAAQPLAARLVSRPAYSMLGRTYSSGYEPDLEYWLLERPVQTVLNPKWPWAIWYPLRRSGDFIQLSSQEQRSILGEHAQLGKAYGIQDLAHDVRLACYGLDSHDNDFVIGLLGADLHPLSHVVQAMRKTRQTSQYISQMGPFFVGHVAWRSSS